MDKKVQKRITFGYNRGISNKIELNELQAMAVKLIYKLYVEGESMGKIAARLETCGIPSPYKILKVAAYCRISTIHENQLYSLENQVSYYENESEEKYLITGCNPVIITEEKFNEVQIEKIRRNSKNNFYNRSCLNDFK